MTRLCSRTLLRAVLLSLRQPSLGIMFLFRMSILFFISILSCYFSVPITLYCCFLLIFTMLLMSLLILFHPRSPPNVFPIPQPLASLCLPSPSPMTHHVSLFIVIVMVRSGAWLIDWFNSPVWWFNLEVWFFKVDIYTFLLFFLGMRFLGDAKVVRGWREKGFMRGEGIKRIAVRAKNVMWWRMK